jgi:hypothetical protein
VGWPARPPTPIPSGRKQLVLSVFFDPFLAVPSPHRSLTSHSGAVLTRRQASKRLVLPAEGQRGTCRPVPALPFHLLVPSRTSFAWDSYSVAPSNVTKISVPLPGLSTFRPAVQPILQSYDRLYTRVGSILLRRVKIVASLFFFKLRSCCKPSTPREQPCAVRVPREGRCDLQGHG